MPTSRRKLSKIQSDLLSVLLGAMILIPTLTIIGWAVKLQIAKYQASQEAQERLREAEKQQHQQEIEDAKLKAAQALAYGADVSERGRKESVALADWHHSFPENVDCTVTIPPISSADESSSNVRLSKIMQLYGDNKVGLLRKSALSETNRSDYELRWSTGSTILQEVVEFDSVGRAIIKLVERRDAEKAAHLGWNKVEINLDAKQFKGDYIWQYGIDGFETTDSKPHPHLELPYNIVVSKVDENSAADKAGLQEGDVLLRFNSYDLRLKNSHYLIPLTTLPRGSEVLYTVFRPRTEIHDLTRAEMRNSDSGTLGMKVNWDNKGYGVVEDVYIDSPAAKAGIRRNDRITSLNGDSLETLSHGEILEKLAGPPGRSIPVGVEHVRYIKVKYTEAETLTNQIVATLPNLFDRGRPSWPPVETLVQAGARPFTYAPVPAPPNGAARVVPVQPKADLAFGSETTPPPRTTQPAVQPSASSFAGADDNLDQAKAAILDYFASRNSSNSSHAVRRLANSVYYYGSENKTPAEVQQRINEENARFPYFSITNINVLRSTPKADSEYDAYVSADVRMELDSITAPRAVTKHFYVRTKRFSEGTYITHIGDKTFVGWQLAAYTAWIGPQDIRRSEQNHSTPFSEIEFKSDSLNSVKAVEAREIIFQDRVNYSHGIVDSLDNDSEFFHVDKGMLSEKLESLRTLPVNVVGNVEKIIAGGVRVEVKIFKDQAIQIRVME